MVPTYRSISSAFAGTNDRGSMNSTRCPWSPPISFCFKWGQHVLPPVSSHFEQGQHVGSHCPLFLPVSNGGSVILHAAPSFFLFQTGGGAILHAAPVSFHFEQGRRVPLFLGADESPPPLFPFRPGAACGITVPPVSFCF